MVVVRVEVRGGVTVRRLVAAADVTARHAEAEVHPAAAHPEAVLAPPARRRDRVSEVDVLAGDVRCRHACPGGALARAEARISLNRVLDRLGDIRISETQHGAGDGRHYDWKPSFLLRGLEALHLEFVPL